MVLTGNDEDTVPQCLPQHPSCSFQHMLKVESKAPREGLGPTGARGMGGDDGIVRFNDIGRKPQGRAGQMDVFP